MIIIFGAPGSGKSVQGQILAARYGWRWLSAGQLMRDTKDPALLQRMSTGELVDNARVNEIMLDALMKSRDLKHVVLDGYPREYTQAQWLLDSAAQHGRPISMVVVLEVPRAEILQRLQLRGRVDDHPKSIDERLEIYNQQIYPILGLFNNQDIPIVHIDGTDSVGRVHDRIVSELEACKLV